MASRRPRVTDSSLGLGICPRCEEGMLVTVEVPHDIDVAGTVVRIPNVQADECRRCGFRSLSGREVRLFDFLFQPQYSRTSELIDALRAAGFYGMFLREDQSECALGFGSRSYVGNLGGDLRELYLDNESSHVIQGLCAVPDGCAAVEANGHRYTIKLPKLGEGENGIVYEYEEGPLAVFKVAKPRPYSRDHLRLECEVTDFFAGHGVPVPEILDHDRYGSFVIKEKLAGSSLAVIYDTLAGPTTPRHRRVRAAVEAFIGRLLELFVRHPEAKTSLSPNNIFVIEAGEECRCLLVDTGPAPFHDYSRFSFAHYWDVTVPEKIARYREVGYI